MLTPLEAMADPALFGKWFAAQSWAAGRTLIAALFGLPMLEHEFEGYQLYTGRSEPPSRPAREAWVVAGRRAGKSLLAALVAVWAACFRNYSRVLSKGERGVVMILASDRQQARVVFGYVRSLISEVPLVAKLIERETAEAIHLTNGISIEVHTSSFRAVRGYTIVCAVLDEIAFWRDDTSMNPDAEIVGALRPAMATVPGALLLGISSPYAQRGVLWESFRDHYGHESDGVLVWKAPSWAMNPTIPTAVIDAAYEADPIAAAAEWGAEFRTDVEGYVTRDTVEACVVSDRRELPPLAEHRYLAFVDPSGGSSDAMTLAVAHREGELVVLDAVRERVPPFSPEAVVVEFANLLKSYGVSTVQGDRYAGEWPRQRFQAAGIRYDPSAKPKRDLYVGLLPVLNSARLELLDVPKLTSQLVGLERRTARGGRDSIDHAPRCHDDVANALAGVVSVVLSGRVKGDYGVTMRAEYGMSERNPLDDPAVRAQLALDAADRRLAEAQERAALADAQRHVESLAAHAGRHAEAVADRREVVQKLLRGQRIGLSPTTAGPDTKALAEVGHTVSKYDTDLED